MSASVRAGDFFIDCATPGHKRCPLLLALRRCAETNNSARRESRHGSNVLGYVLRPLKKKKAHPTLWCTLCICLWRIWVNTHLHPLYFITIQQGKKEREREDKLKPKPKQTSPQGSSEYAEVRCCVYSYANLSSCKSPHIKWILCTRLLNNELSPFQLFLALFRFANSSAMFTGLSAGDARVLHRLLRVYRSDLKRRATPSLSAKEGSSRNLCLCPDL